MRRFSRHLAKNETMGDDLAQDTLVRAWSNRHRFEHGTNFRAWIFRIARNHFLSGIRRSCRHIEWNPDIHEKLLIARPSQEDSIHESDLEAALSTLPESQKQALILVIHHGLNYADAARHLGIESGTLNSRVARGRASVIAYFSDVPPKRPYADVAERNARPGQVTDRSGRSTYQKWKASDCRTIG
ncbi:sigma-70 family RNA polymerase sigma factor [Sphingomonas sp. GB1N7]|uniref:sigma-70 family RNA polymerase sigma factor n=1 Tax=Parasphingomonas caseinilytica TaxID=3096158 RepID=UPI002FCB2E3D